MGASLGTLRRGAASETRGRLVGGRRHDIALFAEMLGENIGRKRAMPGQPHLADSSRWVALEAQALTWRGVAACASDPQRVRVFHLELGPLPRRILLVGIEHE